MIDFKINQLELKIRAIMKDMEFGKTEKLVSMTKQIEEYHPLQVFEGAKLLGKDRFYWSNVDRTLSFTGVGSVQTLEANEDRFQATKANWQQVLAEAVIVNPFRDVPGTGLFAFGGLAFDPLKETTALWQHFKPSQFYIPEFLLTVYEDNYYLTMNFKVSADADVTGIAHRLYHNERRLLNDEKVRKQEPVIHKHEEIKAADWKQAVQQAMNTMKAKEAEKIVLAREVRLYFTEEVEIAPLLQRLTATQENSYIFAFESNGDCFVGATPERLVRVRKKDLLSTCLAGTAPRGKTVVEDERIGRELLEDEKNRQEHEFVVQMIKDALLKTCSNVEMPTAPVLHPLKNLQHLYTPVTGQLKAGYSIFDVVENLHPTPALGGTPTESSLAFIREHEALDRGWYGAPIGWVDSNENGEFAVAIRSGLIQGNEASLFAGCGVLADSDVEMEYEETQIKLLPMLNVLGGQMK